MPIVGLYCESGALLREIQTAFETVRAEVLAEAMARGAEDAAGWKLQVISDLAAGKAFWAGGPEFLILALKTKEEAFKAAERLWGEVPSLSVIYVAGRPEEVLAALPYPFFHVVRGFSLEQDLRAVLQKIQRAGSLLPKWCAFQGKNELIRVKLKEILYLESDRHQIRVYMETAGEGMGPGAQKGRSFLVTETLAQCEERLGPLGFARIHKSFLVNFYHVAKLGKESLFLDCGRQLYISRHRYAEIKFQFEGYIRHLDFL